jgi:hypothetical protein
LLRRFFPSNQIRNRFRVKTALSEPARSFVVIDRVSPRRNYFRPAIHYSSRLSSPLCSNLNVHLCVNDPERHYAALAPSAHGSSTLACLEFVHLSHHRDKAVRVFECKLSLNAPQAAAFTAQFRHTSPKSEFFSDSSQNFDRDYADAVCALRLSALSADSTTPSLAFAHVS